MKGVKFIVILVVVMFLLAGVREVASRHSEQICGLWCAEPPSETAFVRCVQTCEEALR